MAEEEGGDGSYQKGSDGNSRWPTGRGCAAVEQRRQGHRAEAEEDNDVVSRGRGQRPRTCGRGHDWKKTIAEDLQWRLKMARAGDYCDREGNGAVGQRRGSGGRRWLCPSGAAIKESVARRMRLHLWLRRRGRWLAGD
ncbi:hypothetical protein BHE74_00059066 [Ensete ventricosum]|nr:hypothetical protein GW17_00038487 [Ensete ventricosum]RWW35944.1 hypothetical protein BHE74_00059066 [Ensete ventricosum]RZR82492.1 hypothetical protein BHM03_00008934 [Ensete ventricosum]